MPGVDGNWACMQCQNVNFAIRETCNRCQAPWQAGFQANYHVAAPQFTAAVPTGKGGAPVAGVGGNWACPMCQNVNFAVREACNRCQSPKPQQFAPQQHFAGKGGPAKHSSGKGGPVDGVDGNWKCLGCGNVNFAMRENCNRCQAAKPEGGEYEALDQVWPCHLCQTMNGMSEKICSLCHFPKEEDDAVASLEKELGGGRPSHVVQPSQKGKGGAPVAGLDGNWSCPSCQNVNFAVRNACNRCQQPKPQDGGFAGARYKGAPQQIQSPWGPAVMQVQKGGGGGKGGAPVAGLDGNWACPHCQNVNFAVRTTCNRCQAPQEHMPPAYAPKGKGGGKGKSGAPVAGLDGNWACPSCQNVNFAMRETCNRCQGPKPEDTPLSDADLFAQLSEPFDGSASKKSRLF